MWAWGRCRNRDFGSVSGCRIIATVSLPELGLVLVERGNAYIPSLAITRLITIP